ncbi:MAG: acyl-CoA thioesterase [Pirellulaceae bacterium]
MSQERFLAIKVVMMPRDTNPYGTIFGGVLMSYIDQAGAVGARHEIAGLAISIPSLVTVAIDKVEFHKPVFVGDTVSFYTELRRFGRTSITMHVTVETDRDGTTTRLTEAEVTYVAIRLDGDRRAPIPIRPTASS